MAFISKHAFACSCKTQLKVKTVLFVHVTSAKIHVSIDLMCAFNLCLFAFNCAHVCGTHTHMHTHLHK